MRFIALILFILTFAQSISAATLKLQKKIVRPEHYFKTHPEHEIPKDMVIQKFQVHYTPKVLGAKGPFKYEYKLIKKSGDATVKDNIFTADHYGENIVGILARDKNGKVVAKAKDKIFVHFSRSKVGGGDHTKLDPQHGKEWIKGVIKNNKLVYPGMRFLPSIQKRVDKKYNGGKYGFYEVTEPRIFRNPKTGTLIASFHAKVKGKNDAPPGQTVIVLRSEDQGNSWSHDQVIDHDINAVVGYTSFVYWKGQIQCYYAGGHFSHAKATARRGVYRIVSKDDGKTWSKPEQMHKMTALLNGKKDTIGRNQSPICNALLIPKMTWKGKKGDAILVPFYIRPCKFLISLDGGKKWDMFWDSTGTELESQMDEISWDLLEDRTIYVVSRRKAKSGFKNEFIFDLKGKPKFYGQERKNHVARRCHHGSVILPEGKYKGRVIVVNHAKVDREDATIALSSNKKAKDFETRYLTYGAAWGYCDVIWDTDMKGLNIIGESEPFDDVTEKVFRITKAPTRNERFSIQSFQLSLEFYETLVKTKFSKI